MADPSQPPPPAYAPGPPPPGYAPALQQGYPPAYPPGYPNAPYYPPQPQIIMMPQQQQQQQQQQQTSVNVTVGAAPSQVVVVKRGVNHLLHFCITLFFWPWIIVWIVLCIID